MNEEGEFNLLGVCHRRRLLFFSIQKLTAPLPSSGTGPLGTVFIAVALGERG